ncbi:MAG: hypothetical protein Fur0041_04140 [Bacteroidia bacterium]
MSATLSYQPLPYEKRARVYAWSVTIAVAALLFLILFLYKIITPLPPIPPDPEVVTLEIGVDGGFGGTDINPGGGSQGNTGEAGMQNPDPATNPNPSTPEKGSITDDNDENPGAVQGKGENKTEEPQLSPELIAAMEQWKKNKGSASIKVGGDGSGNPYTGGLGNGSGDGPGPGNGGDPGTGGGQGGDPNGTNKCFRSILSKPEILNPTQEEGKVVVNVYVDRAGNVKKAEVNPSGTTTLNSVLRSTATQSAYKIKFNSNNSCAELIVLPIDINFTLK